MNTFWDVLVDNTSWHELSRQQVCKDLIREEIIANGATFHQGDNSFALKQFLLHYVSASYNIPIQIDIFSRGKLASLAILRHLLSFFSRTESSVTLSSINKDQGDVFSLVRDLLPSTILVTSVMASHNPICVSISQNAHVSINTYTILRITPQQSSSTFLSYLTKPLFSFSSSISGSLSSYDCEEDYDNSFIILQYPIKTNDLKVLFAMPDFLRYWRFARNRYPAKTISACNDEPKISAHQENRKML